MSGLTYTARETEYLYFGSYEESFWGAFRTSVSDPTGYYPGPKRMYPDFETYKELVAAAEQAAQSDPREFRTLVFHPHTDARVLNLLWDHTKTQPPADARRNRHNIVESSATTERLLGRFWRETDDPWIREKVLKSPNCTGRFLLLAMQATDDVSLKTTRGWTMPELARMILAERRAAIQSVSPAAAA